MPDDANPPSSDAAETPAVFKWQRTRFVHIDGAIEAVEDDWCLLIGGLQAARIYRVRGGPQDGCWFWAVQIGANDAPFNSGTGHAEGGRQARETCEKIVRAMARF